MRSLALVALVLAAMALPAHAHRLKVFATVEEGAVSGYGFFIGGGRPEGSTVIIRDGADNEVYRGTTDSEGRFSWRPAKPSALTVVIDARDGHVAEARIAEDRFAGVPAVTAAVPVDSADTAREAGVTSDAAPSTESAACVATVDAAVLARLVDSAVARQLRPLLESFEAAEGRIRFNDVAGGIGMIFGLAGMALWATSRRRDKGRPASEG